MTPLFLDAQSNGAWVPGVARAGVVERRDPDEEVAAGRNGRAYVLPAFRSRAAWAGVHWLGAPSPAAGARDWSFRVGTISAMRRLPPEVD
jgi:hypothetical protein